MQNSTNRHEQPCIYRKWLWCDVFFPPEQWYMEEIMDEFQDVAVFESWPFELVRLVCEFVV